MIIHKLARRTFLAAACVASLALAAPAAAIADVSPSEFIASLGDRAVSALTGPELSRQEREVRFREMLANNFDVPAIGKFVLGRYWRAATEEERQEFLKLFEEFLVRSYARRFAEYSGERFEVKGVRQEQDGQSLVQSLVVRSGAENIRVDWRLRPENSDFRILDVIVEGLSMAVTQRDEFASVIQSRGGKVSGLLEVLRKKVGQSS